MPGHQSQLEDASGSKGKDDHSPQDEGEKHCDRKRQMSAEHQEADLDPLPVLQDEDEDHHQRDEADDDRGPCAAQTGPLLTREGLVDVYRRGRSGSVLWFVFDLHACISNNAREGSVTRDRYHFDMPSRTDWSRVGFQGEPGAYSEEAALAILPAAVTVGYPTFSRAFDAVAAREVDAAVLPVENSLGGIVQEVNDLLWERSGLRISGEVIHPVRHCLLGRGEPVVRALSHPQALLQCRRFLEARQIQAVTFHDTAGAARAVAEGMVVGSAAIASAAAAKRYGLKILAEGIQDDDSNQTRFLIIDRGPVARPGAAGLTKASLAFIGSHKPGSLVAALQSLSARGINLTRLDSRPMPDRPWQYRFYVDFEVDDPAKANEALEALAKETTEVKLFGTYPAAGE